MPLKIFDAHGTQSLSLLDSGTYFHFPSFDNSFSANFLQHCHQFGLQVTGLVLTFLTFNVGLSFRYESYCKALSRPIVHSALELSKVSYSHVPSKDESTVGLEGVTSTPTEGISARV